MGSTQFSAGGPDGGSEVGADRGRDVDRGAVEQFHDGDAGGLLGFGAGPGLGLLVGADQVLGGGAQQGEDAVEIGFVGGIAGEQRRGRRARRRDGYATSWSSRRRGLAG